MTDLISVTTKIFFDRDKVVRAMDRKTSRVLSSTGAFARTVMKHGMRRRKAVSEPGAFPSAHVGTLRDLIYFGYDAGSKSLVIGPTLFGAKRSKKTIPQLINEGGQATIVRRDRKTGRQRSARATYRPRPFVALTAELAVPKLRENMEKFDLK